MQDTAQQKPEDRAVSAKRQRFLCPSCNKHTVLWLLPTTQVKDLPIKCKRCGKESIVNIPYVPVP